MTTADQDPLASLRADLDARRWQQFEHMLRGQLQHLQGVVDAPLDPSLPGGETIQERFARIQDAIREIKARLAIPPGQFEFGPVYLPELHIKLCQRAAAIAPGRIVGAVLDGAEHLDPICCDPTWLETAVWNLIENALKYSTAPVGFNLRVGPDQHPYFEIIDNGVGVDPADRERLGTEGERGRRTANVPGTGFGLVQTRVLVERLGGAFEFTEHPDGMVARITLPNPSGTSPEASTGVHSGSRIDQPTAGVTVGKQPVPGVPGHAASPVYSWWRARPVWLSVLGLSILILGVRLIVSPAALPPPPWVLPTSAPTIAHQLTSTTVGQNTVSTELVNTPFPTRVTDGTSVALLPKPPATGAPTPSPTPTVDEAFQAVLAQLDLTWGNDWTATIQLLRDFVKKHPDYTPAIDKLYSALVLFGDDLAKSQDRSTAATRWADARDLEPNRPDAISRLTALTPTPTPAPIPTLFEAVWDSLAGWSGGSDWSIRDGMLVNDGTRANSIMRAPFKPTPDQDYAVEAVYRRTGPAKSNFGVMYAETPSQPWVITCGCSVSSTDWTTIRVEVQGNLITAFQNGKLDPIVTNGVARDHTTHSQRSQFFAVGMYSDDVALEVKSFRVIRPGSP